MNWDGLIGIVLGAVLAGFIGFVAVLAKSEAKDAEFCEKRGGLLVKTNERLVCIKAEVLK